MNCSSADLLCEIFAIFTQGTHFPVLCSNHTPEFIHRDVQTRESEMVMCHCVLHLFPCQTQQVKTKVRRPRPRLLRSHVQTRRALPPRLLPLTSPVTWLSLEQVWINEYPTNQKPINSSCFNFDETTQQREQALSTLRRFLHQPTREV